MFENKVVVITGAGSGIGAALARGFAKAGARVCVSDMDGASATSVADEIGGIAVTCDVRDAAQIDELVDQSERALGEIDIFISNAGFAKGDPDHAASASTEVWQLNWDVHVMAHVHAAKRLLPTMIMRGHGHLVNTASAAGLLNQIGDAAYSATKHAAVSFAESLAITHRDDGIDVSVICPQYVATPLLDMTEETKVSGSLLSAAEAAQIILEGIANKSFLILPHIQVRDYMALRAVDHPKWLGGMRALRRKFIKETGGGNLKEMHKFV